VNYVVNVPNAGVAKGGVRDRTLFLHGTTDAPIQVFFAGGQGSAGLMAEDGAVTLRKPFAGSGYVDRMMRTGNYSEARVLASLADDWKFHPDPEDKLMDKGVTGPQFDDSGWTPISPLNLWQFQGFKDYHGPAWYRIQFTIPPIKEGEKLRIYFGSVDGNAVIYLNGHKLTEHKIGPAPDFKGWDKAFSTYATRSLWKPGTNVLAVKVTSKNDTTGSGITGGVAVVGRINKPK
jgi:hypothetical protein